MEIYNEIVSLFQESKLVPDPRTAEWPLMDLKSASVVAFFYIAIVLLSKIVKFPKMELKAARIIHNGLMTLINFYLVVELLIQASATSWYGPIVRDQRGVGVTSLFFN
jgi:hypothetical protein